MTTAEPPPERNPFPPTAVAQIAPAGSGTVTIATDAVRAAVAVLDDYLAAAAGPAQQGRVLAVVGDYGTGKTHLAAHLLARARDRADDRLQHLYLNAPTGSFVGLYRLFVARIADRPEVLGQRIQRFLADVVADALAPSPLHNPLTVRLRAGTVDPMALIKELGLMESRFLEEVQRRLREVTQDANFSAALTLLLRPGFQEPVWDWLLGADPDESLRERGIATAIVRDESAALAAMGVLALLLGHHRHPLVVVVDELDQLITASARPPDEAQAAFKQMMTTFTAAGALLILVSLPDAIQALRADVRQRIGQMVHMTALTAADTVRYIEESRLAAHGVPALAPFTEESVQYVVEVADGSPRRIIGLCYELYRRVVEEGGPLTLATVRAVTRERLYSGSADMITFEIRRTLAARGLSYHRDFYLDMTVIDYWIPVGPQGPAIALVVRPPILEQQQLDDAVTTAEVVRGAGDHEFLLVTAGHLPARYAAELAERTGREPLVYDPREFGELLDAELQAMERRLARLSAADPGTALVARVDRLSRQLSHTSDLVMRVADAVDKQGSAADRRIRELQDRVADIYSPGPAAVPTRLPEPLDALFTDALAAVGHGATQAVLRLSYDKAPGAEQARRVVRTTLRDPSTFDAVGIAALLQALVMSFRDAVFGWVAEPTGPETARRARLDEICRTFDAILEYLPVYQLERLPDEFLGRTGARGSAYPVPPVSLLADLSARVQQALSGGPG